MEPRVVAEWAAAISGAGGIMWWLYVWAKPRVQAWAKRRKATSMRTMLKNIQAQLHPNGGSSLRDQVDALRTLGEQAVQLGYDNTASIKALADSINDGVAEVEPDGRWSWVNATLTRWLHVSEPKLLGFGWINSVVPAQRESLRERWKEAMDEERELHEAVSMVGSELGEPPIDTHWVLRPLTRTPNGRPRMWRLQIHRRDLTLRQVAVAADGQPVARRAGERG